MSSRGISRQLYNWLSVDAALIAVAWQWGFARAWERPLNPVAPVILACSVWLTYMADRLYDVRGRSQEELLSARHQFTQRHTKILWRLWWCVLGIDIAIAFLYLEHWELTNGFYLLAACLIYTGANQLLSKRFFPKELCVAGIYVAGVAIFLPGPIHWPSYSLLAAICLFNCLSIGRKETRMDRAMQIYSLTRWFSPPIAHSLFLLALLIGLIISGPVSLALALTLCAQWLLYMLRLRMDAELFRILADAALFLGPLILLFSVK